MRRSTADEHNGNTEEALCDARKAVKLEPSNATARKNMLRLEKMEAERLEKLKEETLVFDMSWFHDNLSRSLYDSLAFNVPFDSNITTIVVNN